MSASHSTFNCTVMLSTLVGHAFRKWVRYSDLVERLISRCESASEVRLSHRYRELRVLALLLIDEHRTLIQLLQCGEREAISTFSDDMCACVITITNASPACYHACVCSSFAAYRRVSEICNERTAPYIRDLEERLRGTCDRKSGSEVRSRA